MKIFKNRTFIAIVGILLSLLIFFGLGPIVIGQSAKHVMVTRVAKEIPANKQITDDMLVTLDIGGYNMPSDVVTNKADIVNKYSTMKMEPGDYVLASKISTNPLGADQYLAKLDGKKVATSISIKSFDDGLSGKLQTGDIISLDVANYGEMKQTVIPADLQYVQLLAATTDTGTDNDRTVADKSANKSSTSTQDNMPSTLTVLVTPAQKKSLIDYNKNGIIHASLVYRGDSQTAQKFIDMQDKYLAAQQGGKKNEQ